MKKKELIRHLNDLIEIDAACVNAYAKAIPEIDTPELGVQMERLLNDHVNRIEEMKDHVRKMGGVPPRVETKMPSNEHHSTIGATLETLGALEDIKTAERAAQLAYEVAAMWEDVPSDLHASLEKFRQQEKSDMDFVDHALVSVRAAASLWGPGGEPPILHH